MAARRHDNTPPFEIMGSTANKPQASGRGPRPGGGFGRSLIDAWRDNAGEPLLLRVPRGMALCILAGLLGLLFLSYWVGYSRGGSAAERRLTAIYEPNLEGGERTPPPRSGVGQGSNNPDSGASGGVSSGSGQISGQQDPARASDPRVAGMNYLVLARCPYDEALRLKKFLAPRQVEVMIGPRNNGGLCQVIALRGFTPQQVNKADQGKAFRTQMLAHGRDWKAMNNGRGDDLSSMYYEKYKLGD